MEKGTSMYRMLHVLIAALCCVIPLGAHAQGQNLDPKQPSIQPAALALLKAMSDKLAGAKKLSFTALGMFDVPAANGQPLFYAT
jgi:hypothetical protein